MGDGKVMGQTTHGCAVFMSMNDYRRFLGSH